MSSADVKFDNFKLDGLSYLNDSGLRRKSTLKEKKSYNFKEQFKDLKIVYNRPADDSKDLNSKIHNIIYRVSYVYDERVLESYRTQEHLLKGVGSSESSHLKFFINALEDYTVLGGNFLKLKNELENAVIGCVDRTYGLGGDKRWAKNIQKKLTELKEGDSLWVDSTSISASHATMMRIEKMPGEKFTLYFANTGLGINLADDFHGFGQSLEGVELYRIAVIDSIPTKKLIEEDFFLNFQKACEGKSQKNSKAMVNIYEQLRTLIDGKNLNRKANTGLSYRRQLTNSCSSSCVWAMMRTVLTSREYHDFEIALQVKSLVSHYKQFKFGNDKSSTRKIMILDLIQSLKFEIKGKDCGLLEKIESELTASLQMKDPELKISSSSKVKITKFIKESEKGIFHLAPFSVSLVSGVSGILGMKISPTSMVAHVSIQKCRIEKDSDFHYQLTKNASENFIGRDFYDMLALLGFHIANGEYEKMEFVIKNLLEELGNEPFFSRNDVDKHLFTETFLTSLALQFRAFDNTRSGIAKQLFLGALALKSFCLRNDLDFSFILDEILEKDRNEKFYMKIVSSFVNNSLESKYGSDYKDEINNYKEICSALISIANPFLDLKVKYYLPKTNVWLQGIESLKKEIAETSSYLELKGEFDDPKDYNIEKLIDNSLDDCVEIKVQRATSILFDKKSEI